MMARGALILGVVAVFGVFLEMVMDTPAMGTNSFWRTRPVTWGKVLIVQLLMALALLMPVILLWGCQCWSVRDGANFLPGTLGIVILGLAATATIAAAASFAKGKGHLLWVIPLAIGISGVWWVALLDHGLIVLPIGFIALVLIVAMGLEGANWIKRAVLGLAMGAMVFITLKDRHHDSEYARSAVTNLLDQYLLESLSEDVSLSLRDSQGRLNSVLPASSEYFAPSGTAVPVAEQIFAVLPIPQDYPAIKAQLGLPAETRWYEIPPQKERGELQIMGMVWSPVWKVFSRQRHPLTLDVEIAGAGERTRFSGLRNESQQILVNCNRWRTLGDKVTQTNYFLYSPTRSLVVATGEEVNRESSTTWFPLWMQQSETLLKFYLPPAELLTGGPWRDEEISSLELITTRSRLCRGLKPLENTPGARKEQLQDLAHALQLFGPPRTFFHAESDNKHSRKFGDIYGKEGVTTLLQAPAAPYAGYCVLSDNLFQGFSEGELMSYAARDFGWLQTIAFANPKLRLGKVARDLLSAGVKPDVEIIKFALQDVTTDDYPLLTATLERMDPNTCRQLTYQNGLCETLIKLPATVYEPTIQKLWKRFRTQGSGKGFKMAAALAGEIEALDRLVLEFSATQAKDQDRETRARRVGQKSPPPKLADPTLTRLVPLAPQEESAFYKWYAANRSRLAWNPAASSYSTDR